MHENCYENKRKGHLMKIRKITYVSILIFFSVFGLRSLALTSCGKKDLSDQMGPIRRQGNVGWCYANVAADLISYKYRFSWSKGKQASAVWIAILNNYNLKLANGQSGHHYIFNQAGFISDGLKFSSVAGYACPSELDDIFLRGGASSDVNQKFRTFEKLHELFQDRNKNETMCLQYESFLNSQLNGSSILNLLSRTQIEQALALDFDQSAFQIAASSCSLLRLPVSFSTDDYITTTEKSPRFFDVDKKMIVSERPDLIKIINQNLWLNNPVGIGFYVRLIKPMNQIENSAEGHAALIVGREFKDGVCQYKVRNSWGLGCVHSDGTAKYNTIVSCENDGHFWVKEMDLKKELDSITYFK